MKLLYGENVWEGLVPGPPGREVQGWNGIHPVLSQLALQGSATVVDVGVWKGQSTICMAQAMRDAGIDGCVIAVDTFLGSHEHWSMGEFRRRVGMPDLYRQFLENVYHAGLSEYVVPVPQTSRTAATILAEHHIQPSMVHIDAAHDFISVMNDAQDYWALLAPGGYLVGDDYDESWPGVIRAAGEFSASVVAPLTIDRPKWFVQKQG